MLLLFKDARHGGANACDAPLLVLYELVFKQHRKPGSIIPFANSLDVFINGFGAGQLGRNFLTGGFRDELTNGPAQNLLCPAALLVVTSFFNIE